MDPRIVFGVLALATGVVAFMFARRTRRNIHAMIGAETLPVAELEDLHRTAVEVAGPGGFRRVCEVVGTAQPGPHGLLEAELSGIKCIWHRHTVQRRYDHVSCDSRGNRQTRTQHETVAALASEQPFAVADATGAVLVRPDGTHPDGAEKVVSRFERNTNRIGAGRKILGMLVPLLERDDTIGFVYTEWVLRAGAQLYVHGEASDRYGELAFGKPEQGLFLISTRTEAEVKASSVRKQKLLAFGGLGAAVLGIVLLVLAALG
ncbi:MAG: hypothetical protein QOG46_112 [Pseudonocardiales bacterium]|jgi:hypothetical protein|nr:hypothetical protein [Pseudonocardiales bacterium]